MQQTAETPGAIAPAIGEATPGRKRKRGPRPNDTYRGARRDAVLRGDPPGIWHGITGKLRPVPARPRLTFKEREAAKIAKAEARALRIIPPPVFPFPVHRDPPKMLTGEAANAQRAETNAAFNAIVRNSHGGNVPVKYLHSAARCRQHERKNIEATIAADIASAEVARASDAPKGYPKRFNAQRAAKSALGKDAAEGVHFITAKTDADNLWRWRAAAV